MKYLWTQGAKHCILQRKRYLHGAPAFQTGSTQWSGDTCTTRWSGYGSTEESGGHLGVNKTLNKVRQRYYWLPARNDAEKCCWLCDTCAASCNLWTRNWGKMHWYNIEAPFERIAIYIAEPFPWSDQGNWYLLMAMDYFTMCLEPFAIPNQVALTVVEALVTNFFCCFGVPRELHSD
jgi:hypothetical protein